MNAKAESSTSAKQREANQGQRSDSESSRPVVPQKREKFPPRYGAQHRQDALWEGERACRETN
ncbi:hypothetical protein P692DRAFT_20722463 [Suillus brevipes Sb2]|nr:hypothetical protein P692DRAFT_20722463 [Suillus brevipes Sb2]